MKKISLALLLLTMPTLVSAQVYSKSLSLSGGIYGDGYGAELIFTNYLNENSFTQIVLNGTAHSFQVAELSVPYFSIASSYSYFITVLSRNRKQQSLSLGGGALVGYELINNGNTELSNIVSVVGKSKFIYGGVASVDLDIIISESFSLFVKTSQAYHINSDFGNLSNYSGVGLRYYFD